MMGEQVIVLTDLTKWCRKINYYLNDARVDGAYFGNS